MRVEKKAFEILWENDPTFVGVAKMLYGDNVNLETVANDLGYVSKDSPGPSDVHGITADSEPMKRMSYAQKRKALKQGGVEKFAPGSRGRRVARLAGDVAATGALAGTAAIAGAKVAPVAAKAGNEMKAFGQLARGAKTTSERKALLSQAPHALAGPAKTIGIAGGGTVSGVAAGEQGAEARRRFKQGALEKGFADPSSQGKKKGLAAGLLAGSTAEGLATYRSVKPAFNALKSTEMSPGSRALKVGELGLQAANMGVGLASAHELLKKPKVTKAPTTTPSTSSSSLVKSLVTKMSPQQREVARQIVEKHLVGHHAPDQGRRNYDDFVDDIKPGQKKAPHSRQEHKAYRQAQTMFGNKQVGEHNRQAAKLDKDLRGVAAGHITHRNISAETYERGTNAGGIWGSSGAHGFGLWHPASASSPDWTPTAHPRDRSGKFARGNGGGKAPNQAPKINPKTEAVQARAEEKLRQSLAAHGHDPHSYDHTFENHSHLAKNFVRNLSLSQRSELRKRLGMEPHEVTWEGQFSKADEDKRQVFGWASVTHVDGAPVVDLQGDMMMPDELEKAAYDYVLKSRIGGDMHARVDEDGKLISKSDKPHHVADLIESMVFTPEKIEKMGLPSDFPTGWWVGFKVHDDDVWGMVKKGERKGFSIHGLGKRVPVEKFDRGHRNPLGPVGNSTARSTAVGAVTGVAGGAAYGLLAAKEKGRLPGVGAVEHFTAGAKSGAVKGGVVGATVNGPIGGVAGGAYDRIMGPPRQPKKKVLNKAVGANNRMAATGMSQNDMQNNAMQQATDMLAPQVAQQIMQLQQQHMEQLRQDQMQMQMMAQSQGTPGQQQGPGNSWAGQGNYQQPSMFGNGPQIAKPGPQNQGVKGPQSGPKTPQFQGAGGFTGMNGTQ